MGSATLLFLRRSAQRSSAEPRAAFRTRLRDATRRAVRAAEAAGQRTAARRLLRRVSRRYSYCDALGLLTTTVLGLPSSLTIFQKYSSRLVSLDTNCAPTSTSRPGDGIRSAMRVGMKTPCLGKTGI